MMNEYRRAKRRKVGLNVEVIDTMTDEGVGRLSNLSESGMLMILRRPLCNDGLFQFRISLATERDGARTVEVGAHELWSDEAAAPGQLWTGFRFIDISPADLAFIRDWVDAPGSQYV